MKLTGKAKEEFKKWLNENRFKYMMFALYYIVNFNSLDSSMKYGVLTDWLDSVRIDIDGIYDSEYKKISEKLKDCLTNHRYKARTAAIHKANEIFNNLN
jgi:hypothetical protein